MKRIILILIMGIYLTSFAQEKTTLIKGAVDNHTKTTLTIGESTIALTEKGTFEIGNNIVKPGYVKIIYDGKSSEIFVLPGSQLEISFNESDFFGSFKFKGETALINSFLFDVYYKNNKNVEKYFSNNFYKIYSKSEKEFVAIVDSLRGVLSNPFEEFISKNSGLNGWFVTQKRVELKYSFDGILLEYPIYQLMFHNKKTEFSAGLFKRLNDVDLNNPGLLEFGEYTKYVKGLFLIKIRVEALSPGLKKSDNKWLDASFNIVMKEVKNQKVKDYFLHFYLFDQIDRYGVKNIEKAVNFFNNECSSVGLKKEINDFYQKERDGWKGHLIETYKTVDGFNLDAHIFIPKDIKAGEKRPALVVFHGGSWSEGKPDYGFGDSQYGFVVVCIEYRYYDRYGVLPFAGISDAKSAIRWVRQNADKFNIDRNKIIATGNSAGGHLALCTAVVDTLDEPNENLSISSKPNALLLNSAVYDLEDTWFINLVENKNSIIKITPTLNVKPGFPPMILFHSIDDRNVSFKQAKEFADKMKKAGNDCALYELNGLGHFMWYRPEYSKIAGPVIKEFYKRLGYL